MRKILYLMAFVWLLFSCAPPSSDIENESSTAQKGLEGKFVHMVFFWLNEGVNVEEFIGSTEQFLKKVEVIQSYHIGTPAMTPREVVDNTYSVSLVVTFNSKEDQDIYQEHEAHLKYVEERSTNWHTVKIFDSLSF